MTPLTRSAAKADDEKETAAPRSIPGRSRSLHLARHLHHGPPEAKPLEQPLRGRVLVGGPEHHAGHLAAWPATRRRRSQAPSPRRRGAPPRGRPGHGESRRGREAPSTRAARPRHTRSQPPAGPARRRTPPGRRRSAGPAGSWRSPPRARSPGSRKRCGVEGVVEAHQLGAHAPECGRIDGRGAPDGDIGHASRMTGSRLSGPSAG